MKILICLSNVPDTTTKIKFKEGKEFDSTGVQWIINPWDELALTRALELKEKYKGVIEKITVITVGEVSAETTMRKALAVGADDAIRVNTVPIDSYYTAYQIAEAVKNDGFDLILAGIDSSDYNGGATGAMVAELLNIQSISSVSNLDIDNNEFVVKREIEGGYEILKAASPLLAVVQKGIAIDPKIPAMRGIMMARKKKIKIVEPVDCENLVSFESYEMPQPKGDCKMIDPENLNELVKALREEEKVI